MNQKSTGLARPAESGNHKKPFQREQKTESGSQRYLHYFILLLLTFSLYGWTYGFEYSLSDPYIMDALNKTQNNFNGLIAVFKTPFAGVEYRPVSILTFWIERFLFNGSNPHISHLVNVLLMGLILIKIYDFIIVSRFYENEKKVVLLAFLCSLFFLVHPNHVSVVANIKSRDNLLSMLFGLMAAIQAIRFYDDRKYYHIPLVFFCLLGGFLSKLDVYIFTITPIIVVYLFRTPSKKLSLNFALSCFFIGICAFLLRDRLTTSVSHEQFFSISPDKNPIVLHDTFINRLSLCLTSLYYYLKFLVIPKGYHFIFGYNQIPIKGLFAIENLIAAFTMFLLSGASIWLYKKNRIYLFSLIFFTLSIAYALNLLQIIANIIMDRYNFIPSLGFCIALSALFIDFYDSYNFAIFRKPILILSLLMLTSFTIYRTKDWRNLFTLTEHDMPYLKNSVNAYRIAGSAYINVTLQEEMKPDFNKAYADSMLNIGEKYIDAGLKIYDWEVQTWEAKGLCHFYRKDYPAALSCFLKCKAIDSTYLSGLNYAGFTYWKLNNIDSAYYYFNNVMNKEYAYGYSANNMINMLIENNRRKEADSIINILHTRFPDDIWLNRRINELTTKEINFH